MERDDYKHPGLFIKHYVIEPSGYSVRRIAKALHVSPSTLNNILLGKSSLSVCMALRLEKCFQVSAELLLQLQFKHDLCQARKVVDLSNIDMLPYLQKDAHEKR